MQLRRHAPLLQWLQVGVFDAAPPCTAPDCLLCPFPTRPSWLGPDEKLETLRTAPAPRFSSRSLLSRSKFQARPQLEESRVRQRHDLRITAEHDVRGGTFRHRRLLSTSSTSSRPRPLRTALRLYNV